MTTRLEINARVDAPVEDVFDLMADPQTEESWNPDALEVERINDGPIAPGAQWRGRYRAIGTMLITLEDYERPMRLGFSIAGSRMDMHWAFRFAADGAGTRLAASAELHPKGAMRLLSPLLGPMMRRTFSKRPGQLAAGVSTRASQ
jgi:uncharacterized protein YndB with AHSA1/START domain